LRNGWKVCLLNASSGDLAGIVGFIAKGNPSAAEGFIQALLTRAESLALTQP